MQFKAIFQGVWRKKFENHKNNRGSNENNAALMKKRVFGVIRLIEKVKILNIRRICILDQILHD